MSIFVGVIIRVGIYSWLSMFVLLRIKEQPQVFNSIVIVLLVMMSVLLSINKSDLSFVSAINNNSMYRKILFLFISAIWLQIGYEWLSSLGSNLDKESFMYYEPVLIVMAFPIGLVVAVIMFMLWELLSSLSIYLHVVVVWAFYFIACVLQLVLISKKTRV